MIIYLYYSGEVPDEYTLTLEFDEGQGLYEYKVPVLKLPEISAHELTDRKMVVLIPFYVLKLRYALKKKGEKDLEQLQSYILSDIIVCIDENLKLGNITIEDALKLKRYLHKLCDYLSSVHKELKGMKDMTDESFMTDVDIMCEEHEKAMVEKDNLLKASAKALLKSGMKEQEVHAITKISLDVIASLKEEIEK